MKSLTRWQIVVILLGAAVIGLILGLAAISLVGSRAPRPTAIVEGTPTPSPTAVATPSPRWPPTIVENTPTPTPAATGEIIATPTPKPTSTTLSTPKPKPTAIVEGTPTPIPTPTATAIVESTPTPTHRPSVTPGAEVHRTPTGTPVQNPLKEGLPEPSARCSLELLDTSGKTLGELRDHFASALGKANYSAYAAYPYEQGFAIITRIEKCEKDGTLARDRWANLDQTALPLSDVFSPAYWKRLFEGRDGDFRFFIFTFTSASPIFTGKEATAKDATVWQVEGPSVLPADLRDAKINYPFVFSVMVYQFKAAGDGTVFLKPHEARLGAWEELKASKIIPSWNEGSVPTYISFEADHVSMK